MGELPRLADILAQRFKALETMVCDGGQWGVATGLELLPSQPVGLASERERRSAAHTELLRKKLDDGRRKVAPG